MASYLTDLTLRLFAGVAAMPENRRVDIQQFILASRTADGVFSDRHGKNDLYYSAFALRSLMLLGYQPDSSELSQWEQYLQSQAVSQLSLVELTSLVYSEALLHLADGQAFSPQRKQALLTRLATFRRSDGGFASTEQTLYSSTYQTFLAATLLEVLGVGEEMATIPTVPILRRQRPDGGFVELEKLRHSGTNPTAAAIAFLKMRDEKPENPKKAAQFLLARQLSDGGFQANSQVPIADLLSSFTGFVALSDLRQEHLISKEKLAAFVDSCQAKSGGFFGASWDMECDVEYTFYGLGLLALLSSFRAVVD